MDITSLSTAMSTANLQQQVSVAVLAQNLDAIETSGDGMLKILESSVTPYLGQNIDYSV